MTKQVATPALIIGGTIGAWLKTFSLCQNSCQVKREFQLLLKASRQEKEGDKGAGRKLAGLRTKPYVKAEDVGSLLAVQKGFG